ncbi:hypothetical protein [Sphingomonas sp.]|uniref:hypothetical protein n=1 Tax=Sphingomonas sp. TaxID=28214 RepID=UPI001850D929|nr:hypothetical protein [Sphingomonas sp.]MBA3511902.1 hypothetical protein [Sphingomonas sp.]
MRRAAIFAAAAGLAACASFPKAAVPVTGEWGGRHVGLSLGETSGVLDYDCAAGTIDGPLLPRGDGTFEVDGRHTPGTGGPERVGEIRPSFRARYRGAIRGGRMTLEARVENGVLLGPFTLVKGGEPIIFRCL